MATKFKVGDKVIVVHSPWDRKEIGKIGIITLLTEHGQVVKIEHQELGFRDEHIRHLTPLEKLI